MEASIMTPRQVITRWNRIPENKRNSRMAKQMAKSCGMRSIGEVRCAADMDKRGIKYRYEAEKLHYVIEGDYTPDYTLVDTDDLLIEYKGKMTNETRRKMVAIKKCHPDRRICIVFEKPNNKLSKRHKMRYWQWAEKNGFDWSEHYVKEEWLHG
jgi:hypothetical protein